MTHAHNQIWRPQLCVLRHWSSRHQIYIYIFEHNDFKLFQVEVTYVQRSEWNVTETVALLFLRLDYTRLKGKIQLDFKPFSLCSSN